MRSILLVLPIATLFAAPAAADPHADGVPEIPHARVLEHFRAFAGTHPRLGVWVQSMTPELREYFKADTERGVLVTKIEADGAAADAGLRVGDVLVEIDGQSVSDRRDIMRALSDKHGQGVDVTVVRRGRSRTLAVQLPEQQRDASAWHFDFKEPDLRAFQRRFSGPHLKRLEERLESLEERLDALEAK